MMDLPPWTPGSHGKGAIFPDGELVVWAVAGGTDGRPHHGTVSEQLGRSDEMPVALWIKPGGEVSVLMDGAFPVVSDLAERLTRYNAELRVVPEDEWDFA